MNNNYNSSYNSNNNSNNKNKLLDLIKAKEIIINPIKIDYDNKDIQQTWKSIAADRVVELNKYESSRTNIPYKIILKDQVLLKKITNKDDLIVHKITALDKVNLENDLV